MDNGKISDNIRTKMDKKEKGVVFLILEFHAKKDFKPGKTLFVTIGHMRWEVALKEVESDDYRRLFFRTSPLPIPFPAYEILVLFHDYFQITFETGDHKETKWIMLIDFQVGFSNMKLLCTRDEDENRDKNK